MVQRGGGKELGDGRNWCVDDGVPVKLYQRLFPCIQVSLLYIQVSFLLILIFSTNTKCENMACQSVGSE